MKISNKMSFFLLTFFLIIFLKSNVQASTKLEMSVRYDTHIESIGWQYPYNPVFQDSISGTISQGLRLEAIRIILDNPLPNVKLKYRVHVKDKGWLPWVSSNTKTGTVGEALRIEAIQIKLENAPSGYQIHYKAHVESIGWQDWKEDGQIAGTEGRGLRLEAIRIKIVKDDIPAPSLTYETHVQSLGWIPRSTEGKISGTEHQGLRMEAIKINLLNPLPGMKLKYQTHIQDVGWKPWVESGTMSGTTGKELRMEAIKIMLDNAPPEFHVQYQVHVENIGWMPWVEAGEVAGTERKGLRIEAIRIRLINSILTNDYNVSKIKMPYTFNDFYDKEKNLGTASEFLKKYYLNSKNFDTYPQRFQFLKLNKFYKGVTEKDINDYLVGKGAMEGQGSDFLDAAETYNIDVVYLISHAMWETSYGISLLSRGVYVDKVQGNSVTPATVYNFYGISAYDNSAIRSGSEKAYLDGWTNPRKAIFGAAKWISENYIHNISPKNQYTLYRMRWNYNQTWHQYATDVNWANGISTIMNRLSYLHRNANLEFEVPLY